LQEQGRYRGELPVKIEQAGSMLREVLHASH
jgi:hypothetical protein